MQFGVLGCGIISGTHAQAVAALPDATLAAVADSDPARAAALGAQYGVPAYAGLPEMLAGTRLDVITIATPSGLHAAQACAAMQAGCHVLVEKPMALAAADLDTMLAVQAATGRQLAVVSQHRFDAATRAVQERVAAGAFGRLVLGSATVAWWRSQAYYDSAAWRGTRALDGGVLMNQAIHAIDLLQWLMGPVRSVYAHAATRGHAMESEDVAVAVLRFANDALGTVAATTAAAPGDLTRIEIFGDGGSAVIENDRLALLRLAGAAGPPPGGPGAAPDPAGPATGPAGPVAPTSHTAQIADLIRAIREGGTPLVDGLAGRRPVDIILAIYESARRGREVAVR
ncbi:MAG TPA: Gfo/Idh/MocA family oxidoreductase [Chloroflexia bacterium]|nr:Gfo/Idh/MocA family oxidoreductase [Chloroflexia bacterium]